MNNYEMIKEYCDYLNANNSTRADYYNYTNNNYNKPLYTENADANKIYNDYQGFIRGNMFPNLYNGYKINPVELKPTNEKEDMFYKLHSLCFALIDINLYLDIYPNDKDMLNLFNKYRKDLNKLQDEYQNKFGPILKDSDANNQYPFAWINSPWPWDKK